MNHLKIVAYLFFVLALQFAAPANAQLANVLQAPAAEETSPVQTDLLGRSTPRGAFLGYIRAVSKEDYVLASQFLDLDYLPKAKRTTVGPQVAKMLQTILDQDGKIKVSAMLSDKPDGDITDNLPATKENIGSFNTGAETVEVLLERIKSDSGGQIWVLAAQTLEKIPSVLNEETVWNINRVLPSSLIDNKWGGIPTGHWLVMLALIVLSYLAALLVTGIVANALARFLHRVWKDGDEGVTKAFSLPIRLYLAVWIFVICAEKMGISIIVRQYFSQVTVVVAWIAVLLLVWQLIDVFARWGEKAMRRKSNYGALSAIRFFRRTMKIVAIVLGAITVLDTIGINVTTWLAAFGIGGIALALGAQKTVENLVGSLTVIFDQPVRVGDFCKVGETTGTIEEVGMRSTRIRTNSRTVVTIPNGDFSSQKIENYTHRDKFWFHPLLELRYETRQNQLRDLLVKFRQMLDDNPKVESEGARVRFVGFGANALNIEIFCYVFAKDFAAFLEVQEELNLQIMDLVEKGGSGFAFPSQTLYFAKDTGVAKA